MADKTKRLDSSSTERLKVEETERLETEHKRDFPVFLSKGQIVENRYKVVDMLGQRSGESLVYLCQDIKKEDKNVVLKLYNTGFTPKEEILRKLVEVTHPDIINVLAYGYLGSQLYEIMEYAEGGSLLERLRERPFSEEELIKYVIPEVLNGLKFCHENDIVHRDIKPSNIFYRDKKKSDIVIGDFGISSVIEKGILIMLPQNYSAGEGRSI